MKEIKKAAFVSGEDFYINKRHYIRFYSKGEIKASQASKAISKEKEEEIEKRLKEALKNKNPELFKKIFPEE